MLALIVIAKAPLQGFAKTRLVGTGALSAPVVARLADAFLRDTVATCARVEGVELMLCFDPAESAPYFRELAPHARLLAQVEGDLGARLSAAFDAAFALGASRVVLIGMDTPHVAPRILSRAFDELERFDAVFGPADDGGYYLIALRARCPQVFRDIQWSTSRVLAQSLERARAQGTTTTLLDGLFDIDDAASLERLARLLGPGGEPCPHTARALAALLKTLADARSGTKSGGEEISCG